MEKVHAVCASLAEIVSDEVGCRRTANSSGTNGTGNAEAAVQGHVGSNNWAQCEDQRNCEAIS